MRGMIAPKAIYIMIKFVTDHNIELLITSPVTLTEGINEIMDISTVSNFN